MTHRHYLYSRKIRKNSVRVPPIDNEEIEEIVVHLMDESGINHYGFLDKGSMVSTAVEDYAGNMIYLSVYLIPAHDASKDFDPRNAVTGFLIKKSAETLEKSPEDAALLKKIKGVGVNIYAQVGIEVNSYAVLSTIKWGKGKKIETFSKLSKEKLADVFVHTRNLVREALKHEWVHLLDPVTELESSRMKDYVDIGKDEALLEKEQGKSLSEKERADIQKQIEENKTRYYSHETEVRAWMQSIINEIENKILDSQTPENTSMADVLALSKKWEFVEEYLNPEAKKKMLQGIHTWFYIDRPEELEKEE